MPTIFLRSVMCSLIATLSILFLPVLAAAQTTSPSTTVAPYLQSHLPGMSIESILTVDDGTVPKAGGGITRLVGIPDGIGVVDGNELTPAEPNFFYLLVHHELNSSQGVTRDHGNAGAFTSKWKVDKTTHEVVEGDDLIKQYFDWNSGTSSFVAGSTTFDRFCSADRPAPTALYDSLSGFGTQEILFLGGEETFGGRAIATVVTGADAGNAYHLEHMGFAAFENVVANPVEQTATVVALLDDASNGELYFYVGQKTNVGNEIERAGLVDGDLYALAVVGKPYELDDVIADAVGDSEPVALKLIGTAGDRPVDGADMEARGADTITPVDPAQTFESLKMGGPEDGVWDTRAGFEDRFYFVTKGTSSNGLNAPTRLWMLEFADIANPALGGTMTLLLDGPANRLGSLDNMAFDVVGGSAKLYIQEDLGSDPRLSRIWEYDVATGQLEEIASHDPDRFLDGGASFLTTNEESSGIVSLESVLGSGWYASSVQVHTSTGLSSSSELVEYGQLVLLDLSSRETDLLREPVVSSGEDWDFLVNGVDPGASWKDIGFVTGAGWNDDTTGTPLGASPAPIGYGESAGVLATDVVQPATPRAATYYFRKEFDLTNPSEIFMLDVYTKHDDGAVVYINGVEVARDNMGLDLTVDNTTFATTNEPSERDWKHLPINCENLPLQATGNVLAISIHQENDSSSDIRMDAELFAWRESPDAGAAPVIPTGLAVVNPTINSLEVQWSAQADAKFFRIERQAAADVAWEVVATEYPGSFTSFVDDDVISGTTYNYRIWAANQHGRSGCSAIASGTTVVSNTPVIFSEDFAVPGSFGQFTVVDVLEPNASWASVLWDFGSDQAVQGNNFGSGNGPTEDWLIQTNPINYLFYSGETLEYDSQISFSGPLPQVLYSTDYDPITNTDPNTATWNLIFEDSTTNGSLTTVGPFDISTIDDTAYIAFKYTGNGGSGGQSVRFTMDDVIIKGECGFDFEGGENTDIEADPSTPWTVFNNSSALGWIYDTRAGAQGAINNNFGSPAGGTLGGTAADDFLVSPPIFVDGSVGNTITFDYYENFGDVVPQPLRVLVTDAWTGDPTTTTWTDITPAGLDGSTSDAWIPVTSQSFSEAGGDVRVAFQYTASGTGGGATKRIGVDTVCLQPLGGPLTADFAFSRSGGDVTFIPTVTGGVPPYSFDWSFGDGGTSVLEGPTYPYSAPGTYTVSLTVTDDVGTMVTETQVDLIDVTQFTVPVLSDVRIAAFNTSMNRPNAGDLVTALAAGTDPQIQAVAEVIQRADADIVLLNEFDQVYDGLGNFDRTAMDAAIEDFKTNYLEVAQAADTNPVFYAYHFVEPSNTGVPSGFDFDNNGVTTDPGDAFGFGAFPGQFGMVLLSKHQIVSAGARTFQNFLWKDMPGAFLPPDPNDSDGDFDLTNYYNAAERDVFRLSSKSHWDVPILVPGLGVVHVLASHPTPPVFDDGEATVYPSPTLVDQNGLRNHDEIRFWADYVDPASSGYIYDDDEWAEAGFTTPPAPDGGLPAGRLFVIAGDQNADPDDGDATFNPIQLVLSSPEVDASVAPVSAGALEQVPGTFTNRETKTASFNLRADYALPSADPSIWTISDAWVFWPLTTDIEADLLSASDHRMVVIDMSVPEPGVAIGLLVGTGLLARMARRRKASGPRG